MNSVIINAVVIFLGDIMSSSRKVIISIKDPNTGVHKEINCELSDTIATIKEKIGNEFKFSLNDYDLKFLNGEKVLLPTNRLSNYMDRTYPPDEKVLFVMSLTRKQYTLKPLEQPSSENPPGPQETDSDRKPSRKL
jgi:hypothetical protein